MVKRARTEPSVLDCWGDEGDQYALLPDSEKTYAKVKADVEERMFKVAGMRGYCYLRDTDNSVEGIGMGEGESRLKRVRYLEAQEDGTMASLPFFARWSKDRDQRSVRAIQCDPSMTLEGIHNTWRGFLVEKLPAVPEAEAVELIAPLCSRILEVYAAGRARVAEVLYDWMAALFQRPWRRTGVGLVLHQINHDVWDGDLNRVFRWFREDLMSSRCTAFEPYLSRYPWEVILGEMSVLNGMPAKAKQLAAREEIPYHIKGFLKTKVPNLVNVVIQTYAERVSSRVRKDPHLVVLDCADGEHGWADRRFDALEASLYDPRVQKAFHQFLMARDLSAYEADGSFRAAFQAAFVAEG